jgi:hypothetical protein
MVLGDKNLILFNTLEKQQRSRLMEWYMKNRWWVWTITGRVRVRHRRILGRVPLVRGGLRRAGLL